MHIEKLSVKDREVTVRLSADEIVKLCNSLHYAPEKQQNDIYHKLYSDLLLVRDIKNLIDFNNVSTALLKSDFRENENIVSKKVRRVHFTFDTPVDWSLDGEYGGTVTDVEIVNHQRAVNIIVPR